MLEQAVREAREAHLRAAEAMHLAGMRHCAAVNALRLAAPSADAVSMEMLLFSAAWAEALLVSAGSTEVLLGSAVSAAPRLATAVSPEPCIASAVPLSIETAIPDAPFEDRVRRAMARVRQATAAARAAGVDVRLCVGRKRSRNE